MPINTVLCPIDFSESSAHALELAAAVARACNSRLIVLHANVPLFVPVPGLPSPPDRVPEYERERVLNQAALFVESSIGSANRAHVSVVVSHPTAAILDSAATLPADLIVMGTHGLSGFEHLMLGSVTEKVLRRATCPVLTVPPRAQATSRFPFTRILCAVDFSEWSAAAVDLASSLARESGAALDLLHVIEWPWHEPPAPMLEGLPAEQVAALNEFRRYLVNSATHRLESLVSGAVRNRCAVTAQVGHGKAYVEVLRAAADHRTDLIVLGVHGRNPLDVALFGSTTNQVVRRAACPVLTLRR
jgi:nucleotide-binding universal stress UspA family protein